jgi:hypothetical protein
MENNNTKTILSILAVLVVIGLGVWAFTSRDSSTSSSAVNDFEECVLAGYPVMESYPRQCRTSDGRNFTEDIGGAQAKGGCYIGGCSSQICSDQPDMASTCEYREEYGCYKTATCERQVGGECGWTATMALNTCLNVILYPDAELK